MHWIENGWSGIKGYGMGIGVGVEATFKGREVSANVGVEMDLPQFSFGCIENDFCEAHEQSCDTIMGYQMCVSTESLCDLALGLNASSSPYSCGSDGICARVDTDFQASGNWKFAGLSWAISGGTSTEVAEVEVAV